MTKGKIKQALKDGLANSETFEGFFKDYFVEIIDYKEIVTKVKKDEMFYSDTKKFAREIWDKNEEKKMPF